MSSDSSDGECEQVSAPTPSSHSLSSLTLRSPFNGGASSSSVPEYVKNKPQGNKKLSWLWEFFHISNPLLENGANHAVTACCTLCTNGKVLNMPRDGSTSVLLSHMRSQHHQIYKAKKCTDETAVNISVPNGKKRKTEIQSKIDCHLLKEQKFDQGVLKRLLVKWIVRAYMPFTTCIDSDFREILEYLNPYVKNFGVNGIKDEIIRFAHKGREYVKTALEGQHFALTTDHWTSRANDNYAGVTAHYINANWELKTFTLCCCRHEGTQGAVDIIDLLDKTKEEFGLSDDYLMATVTDTAASMNLAGQLMNRPHHYCADHVLELTAKLLSDLKGVHAILKNCRAIVGSINQSSQVAEHIEKLQKQFNQPILTVIQDVITRWWSTYNMLERFFKLKHIIDVLCKQKIIDHSVSDEEFKFIELLLPVLYPFKLFQQSLEGENYVTLSSLPDMINRIRIHLSDIASKATTTATVATSKLDKHNKGTNDTLVNLVNLDDNLSASIGNICKILLEDFNNRWGNGCNAFDQNDIRGYRNRQIGIPKLSFIAAAMDPRMKSLDCMNQSDKDKTWLCVLWLLEEWLLCKDVEPIK